MYLCAGDKAIGAKNFHSAAGSKQFRRELATKAVRQGLSPRNGLEAVVFNYKPPEKPLGRGPARRRTAGTAAAAGRFAEIPRVKSIADIRPSNRKLAAEIVKRCTSAYESYEKLLAAAKDDGLEAVIIALPSHLHAPAALAALDKGLHVFIEPPMALTVADAKKIVAKAEEKKLCVAVGQQRHYNLIYDNALEMVRKDLLHQPHYLRAQWHLAKPEKAGGESTGGAAKANGDNIDWWPDVPKEEREMDFAGYQSPDELVRWRLYEKYSGGLLAELGSQLFDAAAMLVAAAPNHDPKRPYPLSVAGSASQVLKDAEGDIDDHVHCIFEYAIQGYVDAKEVPPKARKKIALQFDLLLGSDFDTYGETVLGRRGLARRGGRAPRHDLLHGGQQQGPPRDAEEGRQGRADRAAAVGSAQGRQGRRGVGGFWRIAAPRGRPRLCRRIGALGLLLPSRRRRQERRSSPAATPAPASTRRCSRWPRRRPSSSAPASISRTSGSTRRAKKRRTDWSRNRHAKLASRSVCQR